MNDKLQRLAFELADECARLDIKTQCARDDDGWHDTNPEDSGDAEWVARALRYLDLRGDATPYRVERKPGKIRFRSKG